ncbi:MAG: hypothetical protein EBR99_03660, partial [Actinobacteria bacterium]|nr:hypothetical protein [Actinomycetota bacterium]
MGASWAGTNTTTLIASPASRFAWAQVTIPLHQDGSFNVRNYGATGDGTTDDTAAVQAAINAAEAYTIGGLSTIGSVIVPPGVFRVSSLELTNASIEGKKWSKQPGANSPTLKALSGQTNGSLLHIRKSTLGNVGPTVKNITILG